MKLHFSKVLQFPSSSGWHWYFVGPFARPFWRKNWFQSIFARKRSENPSKVKTSSILLTFSLYKKLGCMDLSKFRKVRNIQWLVLFEIFTVGLNAGPICTKIWFSVVFCSETAWKPVGIGSISKMCTETAIVLTNLCSVQLCSNFFCLPHLLYPLL